MRFYAVGLLLAVASTVNDSVGVNGFQINQQGFSDRSVHNRRRRTLLSESYLDSLSPDEVSNNEVVEREHVAPATEDEPSSSSVGNGDGDRLAKVKTALLRIAAASDRGQVASPDQKRTASSLIDEMTLLNPNAETTSASARGTWELVYCSTQLFRSSPFFMAGRAVCADGDEAKRYDWFCDMHRAALAISNIGKVRQIVSDDTLTSEFEVKVGAVPFLSDFTPFKYSGGWPVTIEGAIVSAASIDSKTTTEYKLFMDTVEIKGSNIPLLAQALPNVKLRSRDLGNFLEETVDSYTNPKPVFRTVFLDDDLRISTDQDDNVFVYSKVDDDTDVTDYGDVMADLGVGKLLEGFNDAITKFYL